MNTPTKLKALRELMQKNNIDAFIVYSADPHMSEYLPTEWKEREWLSNFTGSAGLVVVTKNKAGLWTDSRYFVQATKELADTGITLFKQGNDGVPTYIEWLKDQLSEKSTIAINGLCCAHDDWQQLEYALSSKDIKVKDLPLLEKLWENRSNGQIQPIFIQPIQYAGISVKDKLATIRQQMQTQHASLHIISSLDDIAWILNLRGNDVAYNPVFLSYLLIYQDNAILFTDTKKCNNEVKTHLIEANVELKEYSDFFEYLDTISNENIWIAAHSNQTIFEKIEKKNKYYLATPPSQLLKAVKNSVEIENVRKAMVKDGVALVNFFFWLKENISITTLNEYEVGEKLLAFRAEQEHFKGASFGTIAGYNENGAIVHYSAKKDDSKTLQNKGVLLLDSGGQYIEGTTDITRTIPLGEMDDTFRKDYTLVLKGMIVLSLAKFPKGTRGCNLDAVTRQHLWNNFRNYGHGTGHGVGCFLNVHEGPQSIRQELKDQPLLPGMITSNEPGLYREGKYGIRHENLTLCVEAKTTEFGTFYQFETLTICPFFTNMIDKKLLDSNEIEWLNNYHKICEQKLSPYLNGEVKKWFLELVKPI